MEPDIELGVIRSRVPPLSRDLDPTALNFPAPTSPYSSLSSTSDVTVYSSVRPFVSPRLTLRHRVTVLPRTYSIHPRLIPYFPNECLPIALHHLVSYPANHIISLPEELFHQIVNEMDYPTIRRLAACNSALRAYFIPKLGHMRIEKYQAIDAELQETATEEGTSLVSAHPCWICWKPCNSFLGPELVKSWTSGKYKHIQTYTCGYCAEVWRGNGADLNAEDWDALVFKTTCFWCEEELDVREEMSYHRVWKMGKMCRHCWHMVWVDVLSDAGVFAFAVWIWVTVGVHPMVWASMDGIPDGRPLLWASQLAPARIALMVVLRARRVFLPASMMGNWLKVVVHTIEQVALLLFVAAWFMAAYTLTRASEATLAILLPETVFFMTKLCFEESLFWLGTIYRRYISRR